MSMKRLFVLRHNKGGAIVKGADSQPMYFKTKQDAKRARDVIGGTTVVSYGIDHKRYKGV